MFLLLTGTVMSSQMDKAMDIFLHSDNDVSTLRASKKWVNPTIQDRLDLDYVLKGTDDLLSYGQLYKRWRDKIVERIHVMYTESKTDTEKLHWFMVMTTVTQRDNEIISLIMEPIPANKNLSRELRKMIIKEDTLDTLFYLYEDEAKRQLWDFIVEGRKSTRGW